MARPLQDCPVCGAGFRGAECVFCAEDRERHEACRESIARDVLLELVGGDVLGGPESAAALAVEYADALLDALSAEKRAGPADDAPGTARPHAGR